MLSEDLQCLSNDHAAPDSTDINNNSAELDALPHGHFPGSKTRAAKAINVLGRDPSREKVMNVMGLEISEIEAAKQANVDRALNELARSREQDSAQKNKRDNTKALGVLGHDPSTHKVMDTLGVDVATIQEAKQENIHRREQVVTRQRRNSGQKNKKHATKALEIMGYDPSVEKVMTTLGMDDEDMLDNEVNKIEEYEGNLNLERKRSNSLVNNRKASKALRVLGLDPSIAKVMDKLGMSANELEAADTELFERGEERIKRQRENDDRVNKRNISKALRVLGHDPSGHKIESMMGFEKGTVQIDLLSNKKSPRYVYQPPLIMTSASCRTMLLSIFIAALAVACYLYFYRTTFSFHRS